MNPNRPFFGFVSLFFLFVLLNVGIAFSAASCNDSDGGNNLDKKGSVSGMTSEGQFFLLGDSCDIFDPFDKQLVEYVCTPSGYKMIKTTCPEGKVCENGACVKKETPKATCTDTDDGSYLGKKGTVTVDYKNGTKVTKTDGCDGNQIVEYYCSAGSPYWDSTTLKCNAGYVCKGGACEKEPAVPTCTDSDGKDISVKGTTSGIVYTSGAYSSTSDSCASPTQVSELYCEDNYMKSTMETCPSGYKCSDGACIYTSVECTDSDGGQVLSKKGTVTITKSGKPKTYADSCNGSDKIIEYYCNSNRDGVSSKVLKCPGTSTCTDGACINNTVVTPVSGSGCTSGVCPGTIYGTSGGSSGNLKKTRLREFLLSPGWTIDLASVFSSIFQSGIIK